MLRGMHSGRRKKAVGERRERGAGGGFGAVRRDLGGRDRKSRGCAGRSTPEAKQTWSRTHQESGVIFAVPGFSCPLRLSLSHCGNGHLLPRIPVSHGRESPHASAYLSPFPTTQENPRRMLYPPRPRISPTGCLNVSGSRPAPPVPPDYTRKVGTPCTPA